MKSTFKQKTSKAVWDPSATSHYHIRVRKLFPFVVINTYLQDRLGPVGFVFNNRAALSPIKKGVSTLRLMSGV